MRVATEQHTVVARPGGTASVVVDVINNDAVIDGVSARVIGHAEELVNVSPDLLSLFPDTSGRLTVALTVPKDLPAGTHPLSIELTSHGALSASEYVDVELDVSPLARLRMSSTPRVVRARRSGRFVVQVRNDGNVALDVALQAVDVDRAVTAEFSPPALHLEPGATTPVLLHLRGPRMITGAEIDRVVSLEAVGTSPELGRHGGGRGEPPRQEISLRLRQRPLLSRGLLTALVLVGIIALWAGAFLLGVTKVFAADAMTKQAPASFFAGQQVGGHGQADVGDITTIGAPAGALPKSGQLPPGIGGQITGTVRATSDGKAVGRIYVQAWRKVYRGSSFTWQTVSSAATQTDGTYTLAGLFPTQYYLQFEAAGFHQIWYPNSPTRAGARPIEASAQAIVPGVDVRIAGSNATISGTVDFGDITSAPVSTVRAVLLTATKAGPAGTVVARTTTHGHSYVLRHVPAPDDYELTFTTPGYQTATLQDSVDGGEQRIEPEVALGSSGGSISGIVSSGGTPLPGVTVTTTVGGSPYSLSTPTVGQPGAFLLSNLPTPATYVLRFSAPGYGSTSKIVDLSAGQNRNALAINLVSGTNSIQGTVYGSGGTPLGGVTVTVGGTSAATPPTTTTLTGGSGKGSFYLNALPSADTYTLTFTLTGYDPTTVLAPSSGSTPLKVHLTSTVASVNGRVFYGGKGLVGATVTATNGTTSQTTTTTSAGDGVSDGGYRFTDLSPGTYSITATSTGLQQQTLIVTVGPAQVAHVQTLTLRRD